MFLMHSQGEKTVSNVASCLENAAKICRCGIPFVLTVVRARPSESAEQFNDGS